MEGDRFEGRFRDGVHQADVSDPLVARASTRLRNCEAMIPAWSPTLLKMELERWLWSDRDHVSEKAMWDAFSAYCYPPRLLDENVLVEAIAAGVRREAYFGFAASVSSDGHYEGLMLGEAGSIHLDAVSVLVKPGVARRQVAATQPRPDPGQAPKAREQTLPMRQGTNPTRHPRHTRQPCRAGSSALSRSTRTPRAGTWATWPTAVPFGHRESGIGKGR